MSSFGLMGNRIENWLKASKEFLEFLAQYEPKVNIAEKEEIFHELPLADINGFLKEPLEYNLRIIESKVVFISIGTSKPHLAPYKKRNYQFYLQDKVKLDFARKLLQKLENTNKSKKPSAITFPKLPVNAKKSISPSCDMESKTRKKELKTMSNSFLKVDSPVKVFLLKPPNEDIDTPNSSIGILPLTFRNTGSSFTIKPNAIELPDREVARWKSLYLIVSSNKSIDMRLYLDHINNNPEIKKLLDLYLMHKKVAPSAKCKVLMVMIVVEVILEKMVLQTYPNLSTAKRNYLLQTITPK